ncbi:multiple epidermal growth factor-like domains protein 10 isoform X3 [Chironomus tepperi]
MMGMLSKIIEINGTIDQVMMEGSTTESAFGRVWLNATERPSGICQREEEYTEEIEVIERIPYQVEVEIWCWSIRCTEWETHYREEKHKKNVTQTRKIHQCCENYELDPDTNECRPICIKPCENQGTCVEPNRCKCEFGYEGDACEYDALPDNLLSGPNVCERVEMKEEMERIVEQELVETSYKEWCWPKIRCTHTKIEQVPVEKQKKALKPYPVKYCCHGYVQNYKGNRCLPIENIEDVQQQVEA